MNSCIIFIVILMVDCPCTFAVFHGVLKVFVACVRVCVCVCVCVYFAQLGYHTQNILSPAPSQVSRHACPVLVFRCRQ